MSEMYPGVLNTGGSARYGHPALFGALPQPWLPVLAEPKANEAEVPPAVKDALLVVDLRRGWRNFKRAAKKGVGLGSSSGGGGERNSRGRASSWGSQSDDDPSRAWRGSEENFAQGPVERAEQTDDEDEDEEVDEEGQQTSRCAQRLASR